MNLLDLSSFAAILLDLDGTVYHEEHALPGAVELIRHLQTTSRNFACLSNSTSSPRLVAQRLARMGVTVAERSIYTAGAAAADYVMDHFGQRPRVYNLATDGAQEMLHGKVQWVSAAGEPCDVVLVGTPGSVWATEDRQRVALDILRRQRASSTLLGMCADRVFPSPRGIEFGCGAMTAMLAYAADVRPVFTGKPEPVFFHDLCRRIGVEPGRCVLVGDNLESDIYGGNRVGMTTVLALSGVARREDLTSLAPERQPKHVIQDLRELLPSAS